MKKSFKKLVLAGAIATAMSVGMQAPNAHASGIFTFNPSALAEMVNQGVQAAKQWAEEKAAMITHMQQDILLQAQKIMNDNNIAANEIARTTQVDADIQNNQLAQDLAPHKGACDTIALSVSNDEGECKIEDNFKKGMAETIEKKIDLKTTLKAVVDSQGEGAPTEYAYMAAKEILQEELKKQVDYCAQELEDDQYEPPTEGAYDRGNKIKSPCTNLHFIAGGEGVHLTPTMDESAIETIKVLVTTPTSNTDVPNASKNNPEEDIKDYRRYAYEALVLNSLHRLRVMHAATDSVNGSNEKVSFMGALDDTIKAKFGSIEGALGIMEATNTDKKKETTPGVSAKSLDEIARFNLYINYLKYQQQIRMEALMAATLALELQKSDLQ